MSSLIGYIGKPSATITQKFASVSSKFQFVYQKGLLTLLADASLPTTLHSAPSTSKNWVVVGTGLFTSPNDSRFMTAKDWEQLLDTENPLPRLLQQDGHFLLLSWDDNKMTVYTDATGLKSLYYFRIPGGILFSDSHDFLVRTVKPGLNLSEFGSHWLLFNKISDKSIFSNVKRLVGGNSITITIEKSSHITETGFQWIPSLTKTSWSNNEYYQTLDSLVSVTSSDKKKSLSLSGGMDSRVLLALMLKDPRQQIHTHTFGESDASDYRIARKLADTFHFHIDHHFSGLTSIDQALSHIRAYTNLTQVNNPASAFLQFQNYYLLDSTNYFIIDGGFGEIWRREFFVKLFLTGESAIQKRSLKDILPALRLHRADIFNGDAVKEMECGIASELNNLFDYLPSLSDVTFEDWLDIFAIKTRLLNYYANEQSVLDSIIQNVMPFASLKLLNNLCSIPVSKRKNGKLFREIIRMSKPELAEFRLAKNDLTVSFSASTLQLRILKKLSRFLKKSGGKRDAPKLLTLLKPYILDTLESADFKQYPYYNTDAIRDMADRFYETGTDYADELDWWLAFEVFRQEYL